MQYPEYPIDNRIIFKAEIPKDKILRFKGVLHSNLSYYSENSIRHPAKMSILLTKWILQKFTKEEETVIDPMSGIGTTLFEAVNMNRNCIAVEFEKKFVDWSNENVDLLNKNKPIDKRGKGVVLQGDARDLTDILNNQIDKIVFSPPYCETEAFHDQDFTLRSTKVNPTSRKISEQKYGKDADAVVMSPPFASSPRAGNKDKDEFWKNQEQRHNRKFTKSKKILDSMHYSENKDNIGNLPKGDIDTVITSPPHGNSIGTKAGGRMSWCTKDQNRKALPIYSTNKDNIGNLPKGEIDTVVMSPPYSESLSDKRKGYTKIPQLEHTRQYHTQDPDNIGNLPKGEIDTVINSPPFSQANRGGGIAKKGYKGKHGKDEYLHLRHERQLTDDGNNISNLPHGEISAIITSPPYEHMAHNPSNIEQHREIMKNLYPGHVGPNSMRNANEYSENPENLGNLKKKSYLSEMKKVYEQCYSVLKHGGLAVLVTKNFVRNYKMIRLDMDTMLLMESCGFVLVDRYFRSLEKPSFWILNYRKQCKKKGIPDPTAHFEDILAFKKEN